jgi:hypothetical protein
MIKSIAAAGLAAFIAGSGSAAFAAAMDHDPTTGLNTYYYYGPINEMAKKGLPMKDEAKRYSSSPQSVAKKKTTPVFLMEDRGTARTRARQQ